jgi:hypothetical protein
MKISMISRCRISPLCFLKKMKSSNLVNKVLLPLLHFTMQDLCLPPSIKTSLFP